MPHPPGGKKKKKGRPPAHQNTFAFRHNAKSKKTEKILSSPNVGVCRRCWEKIEWRKKYRKYKPRTQPGKCNLCFNRNVMAAYHTICTKCAVSDAAVAAMEKHQNSVESNEPSSEADNIDESLDNNTSDSQTNDIEIKFNRPRRKIKVCAICTHEPALSKYDNMPEEASELVSQIQELEDTLESGINEDGHKLTLREAKAVERQLDKLRIEIKEFGKKKSEDCDDDEGGRDGSGHESGSESDGDESNDSEEQEEKDPFLFAVGGKDKLLVGDAYQKMLLAKAESQKSG